MASQQQETGPPLQISRKIVFPLFGGRSTWGREHLLPIFVTVCVAFALMVLAASTATGTDEISQAWLIFYTLAIYIAFLVTYYVNQMCGQPKRLWVLGVVALATALMLDTKFWSHWAALFYNVIPGEQWEEKSSTVVAQVAGYWFGTGLCEEGFKALPLIVLALLGGGFGYLSRHAHGRSSRIGAGLRKHICLCGPRDGIVMGVASGCGFFIRETLGQYVPQMMGEIKYAGSQAFHGLLLLLGRGLPELTGHSAYSGLLGYFIGLSVLRPKMAVYLLPLGWLSASALHGAWDAIGNMVPNPYLQLAMLLILALLSYGLLGGAIFAADDISTPQKLQPVPATAALGAEDDSG